MHGLRLWILLLALSAAGSGCFEGGEEGGERVMHPREAWTSWDAAAGWDGPRASMSTGCGGPCAGASANGPEFHWTGTDGAGRVLHVQYAVGEEPGIVYVEPDTRAWAAVLDPVFAAGDEYAQGPDHGVRVFAVDARRLGAADAARLDEVLEEAEGRLRELGPPVYDCQDCPAPVLKAGGLTVEARGNVPDGSGWADLQAQMWALASWIRVAA